MNFVDTHAHVFSRESTVIPNARYQPSYDATVGQFLANLDAHQIRYGVLVQISFYGTDNSHMLQAVAQAPDRLKAVAVVPLDIDWATMQQYQQQGVCGIRLNLFGLPIPDVQTEQWQQFAGSLKKLGWHIELHCPPAYLIQLLPALAQYDVPVVIDHLGRLPSDQAVDSPEYLQFLSLLNPEQHWLKLSGLYRFAHAENAVERAQDIYARLKQQGMLQRIVWGSDWPHTQHESETDYTRNWHLLHQVVPDETERQLILSDNPCRLFGFQP